jgi:hypothetical protein
MPRPDCNSAHANCSQYKSVQVNISEYNQMKKFRAASMKRHQPITINRQGKKMGAGKCLVPMFLPPSFCLSGAGEVALDGGQDEPIWLNRT